MAGIGITTQRDASGVIKVVPGEGKLRRLMGPAPPGSRSLIWIPAVPSSGTSAVAGVLQALGVNMGSVGPENKPRGYAMNECREVNLFTFVQKSPLDSLLGQRIRFRDYIQYRLYKAEQEGDERPQGVKALASAWMYDLDPPSLPVQIVDVYRPLEVSVVADARRVAGRPDRAESDESREPFQHINRAGGIAGMWLAKLMLYDIHPPKVSVSFDKLREQPEVEIQRLIDALELEPDDRQRQAAILSVRPK